VPEGVRAPVRSGKGPLFQKYEELSGRMNKKKSVVAVARKMVISAWLLMKRRDCYHGVGNAALEKKLRYYKIKKWWKRRSLLDKITEDHTENTNFLSEIPVLFVMVVGFVVNALFISQALCKTLIKTLSQMKEFSRGTKNNRAHAIISRVYTLVG
jgi:hypothetical protein